MRRRIEWILMPVVLALAFTVQALPQGPSTALPTALQVKVEVVLTKNEGLSKVVMPYSLFISSSGEPTSLRIGAEVPVPVTSAAGQQLPYTFQQVGMQIECAVRGVDGPDVPPPAEGPFKVGITITKRDVYDGNLLSSIPQRVPSMPAFYNFTFAGTLILSNGGTAQISGTDMVTNETWLADVTVSVKK
jgi:hypothetical protein